MLRILLLSALLSGPVAAQLAVGPVVLPNGGHTISYEQGPSPDNSVIRCPYALEEGQRVVAVIWEVLQDDRRAGSFKWRPNRPGTTTGILNGNVNLRREDGDLELTSLDFNLAATYSCTVKANDGSRGSARGDIHIEGSSAGEREDPRTTVASDYSVGGAEVGPIVIGDNRRYISYEEGPSPANSLLRCPFRLGPGQQVQSIVWRVQKKGRRLGSYKWKATGETTAYGILKGKVNLGRRDGDLELTILRYNMAATYSCTVILEDGTKNTAEDEILIVDTTGNENSYSFHEDESSCTLSVSESTFIFPQAKIKSGMFSEQLGGYYQPFDQWEVTNHQNLSTTYAYNNHVVYIDTSTPPDAAYRTEVGVTKSNGEYIPITRTASRIHVPRFERSCKDLEVGPNQLVSYNSYQRTCFGGIRKPEHDDLQAEVRCAEGYVSQGFVNSVVMTCMQKGGTEYKWMSGTEGIMPYHLVCELPPETTEAPATTAATTTEDAYGYPDHGFDDHGYPTEEYPEEDYEEEEEYPEEEEEEEYPEEEYPLEYPSVEYHEQEYPEKVADYEEEESYTEVEECHDCDSDYEYAKESYPMTTESPFEECMDCGSDISMGVVSGQPALAASCVAVAAFSLVLRLFQ